MSEYQYYEFRAVDRALTRQEMAELRRISTRAEITPTSLTSTYNWGDFGGNPLALVERYFDAFLYVANWGNRRLMLRLPRRFVAVEDLTPYLPGEQAECHERGEHLILELRSQDEKGDWESTGEGWLTDILPIREALIRGDRRALYIGWLLEAGDTELGDDAVEPPVPPGLGSLSPALQRLAEFLRIDQDLLAVASERSAKLEREDPDEESLRNWITSLPADRKDEILFRLARGRDQHLGVELQRRFDEDRRAGAPPSADSRNPRTAGELLEMAERHAERRQRQEAAKAARERQRQLDALAAREPEAWLEVEAHIETKQSRGYDAAVLLLKDLRDLAARDGRQDGFEARIRDLHLRYKGRSALHNRLDGAKLMG